MEIARGIRKAGALGEPRRQGPGDWRVSISMISSVAKAKYNFKSYLIPKLKDLDSGKIQQICLLFT